MLKESHQSNRLPEPDDERPVGDLVSELVEDGKAYAKAEFDLAKAIATAKAKALRAPAIMFFGALLLIQGAVNLIGFAVFLTLLPLMGPILAGLLVFALMAGTAGVLAWIGAAKLREDL